MVRETLEIWLSLAIYSRLPVDRVISSQVLTV
jgi:hypothetical protein